MKDRTKVLLLLVGSPLLFVQYELAIGWTMLVGIIIIVADRINACKKENRQNN